jgi:hypothetical protein
MQEKNNYFQFNDQKETILMPKNSKNLSAKWDAAEIRSQLLGLKKSTEPFSRVVIKSGGCNLYLMSSLGENEVPAENKMYLEKQGNKLKYVARHLYHNIRVEGEFNIPRKKNPITGELTQELLVSELTQNLLDQDKDLRAIILKETSKQNLTGNEDLFFRSLLPINEELENNYERLMRCAGSEEQNKNIHDYLSNSDFIEILQEREKLLKILIEKVDNKSSWFFQRAHAWSLDQLIVLKKKSIAELSLKKRQLKYDIRFNNYDHNFSGKVAQTLDKAKLQLTDIQIEAWNGTGQIEHRKAYVIHVERIFNNVRLGNHEKNIYQLLLMELDAVQNLHRFAVEYQSSPDVKESIAEPVPQKNPRSESFGEHRATFKGINSRYSFHARISPDKSFHSDTCPNTVTCSKPRPR